MEIYIAVLLTILLVGVVIHPNRSVKKKKNFIIFAFVLIIVVAALRASTVGLDLSSHYYRMFTALQNISWSEIGSTSYEAGYVTFYKIVGMVTKNPQWMVAIHTIFVMGVSGWFIYRNSDDVLLSTFMFIAGNTWFMYMTMMRQSMAICMMLIAIEVWKNKKQKFKRYLLFIVFVAFGISLHTSSSVMLLFLIAERLPFKRREIITSTIILVIGFLFYNRIFNVVSGIVGGTRDYAEFYSESGAAFNIITLYWTILYLSFFLLSYFTLIYALKKTKNLEINIETLRNDTVAYSSILSDSILMYMLLALLLCRVMALQSNIIGRMAYYFIPFTWIAIPRAIRNIRSASNKKIVRRFVYCLMGLAFIWLGFKSAASLYGTVPYSFFWR